MAFTGRKDAAANFTPVESYAYFSPSYRAQLAALRVTPPSAGRPNATPVPLPRTGGDDHSHSASLSYSPATNWP